MNIFGKYPIIESDKQIGELEIIPRGSMCRFFARCGYGLPGIFRLAVISGGRIIPIGVMTPQDNGWKLEKTLSPASLRQMGIAEIEGVRLSGADNVNIGTVNKVQMNMPEIIAEQQEAIIPAEDELILQEERQTPSREINKMQLNTDEIIGNPYVYDNSRIYPEQIQNLQAEELITPDEIPIKAETKQYTEPAAVEYETGWMREDEPERLFKDRDIQKSCRDMTDTLIKVEDGYTYLAVPIVRGRPFPAMPIFCFGSSRKINGKNYVIFKIKDGELLV
jgi:Asp-tRNA(Asn)/Glu-tRNA(Gln) amidotransferase C subunit